MLYQQGIETPQQILYGFTPKHISSYWLELDAGQDHYLAWWNVNYPSHPTTEEITEWVQTW
jgi:hypothetical protein